MGLQGFLRGEEGLNPMADADRMATWYNRYLSGGVNDDERTYKVAPTFDYDTIDTNTGLPKKTGFKIGGGLDYARVAGFNKTEYQKGILKESPVTFPNSWDRSNT
ncbi:MAG: hypothetical protein CV045_08465 [Cyanobacteria bacterium M5B4]|nr:MAG: hypothetical protein CV045_08465 [Cyanobacteria bacterium M5B4]